MKFRLLFLALAVACLSLARIAQSVPLTLVATISGGYDLDSYDTPEIIINNTSSFGFTNAQMVLTGYQGINNGVSQTVLLGTISAGGTDKVIWGNTSSGGTAATNPMFIYDYDDSKGGTAPCPPSPISAGLCGDPGNFKITFTADWNGKSVYSVFSPASNATGTFVPFEGLNASGISEDPCCDLHSGSVTGVLANIYEGTPPTTTPEPESLLLFGFGLIVVAGLVWRKTKQAPARCE